MTIATDGPKDEFAIDRTPIWPDEDGRLEPIFLDEPVWIAFEEPEPPLPAAPAVVVEFDEFALAEPELGTPEPDEPLLEPGPRASSLSLSISLLAHLLTLLVLTAWTPAPAPLGGAIPVQLVIEKAAAPQNKPVGETVADAADPAPPAEAPPPADSAPAPVATPPAPPRVASTAPAPKPSSQRLPAPPRRSSPSPSRAPAAAAAAAAVPAAHVAAPAPTAESRRPPAVDNGRIAGVSGGRGDYFAYLEQLTRPYLYMLSPNFLAGRRGRTILSVAVRDDGTIIHVEIKRSSGYPDIDARIEQMVQAVGRFPPLPPHLRRPGADLDFNLVFPEVLQE